MTITIGNLTNPGNPLEYGVFDHLMETIKAHLDIEYNKGRIKGPEYSQVYLGALESMMQASLTFLLTKDKADQEAQLLAAQIQLAQQQKANAILEGAVLVAQECKLRAEYDLLLDQHAKAGVETALLNQKLITEKAQTMAGMADDDSVLGKQKALYTAQATGFTRDAEQKAATIMVDSWKIRRTTDEGTVADETNKLSDAAIGRAVNKLLSGVGA